MDIKGSLPNPLSNTIPYFIAYNIIFYHLQNLDRCNMIEMFSKICLHRMSWQMLHFLPGLVNYKLIMQLNVFMIKLKLNIPISVTMIFLNNLVRYIDGMYHNNFSHFIYITFQWTSIILNRYIKSPTLNMPKILFMHEFRECLCMRLWGTTKQNIEFVIFAVYINNVFALLAHVQKITTLVSCVYNYIESDWMSILGANIFFCLW